jgi:energy-coupling factor transporter ATP-binding protein EcfA2
MRLKLAAAAQTSPQPVAASSTATPAAYEADAPTADEVGLGQLSPEQEALDKAIEDLSIVDAYNKWCKKMVPKVFKGQRESIKCSCPNPQHPDKNPSAWMNIDKNTYFCSGCSQGGDQWDIAAYHFGFPVPGYKQDKEAFRQLREKMAVDLGFATTVNAFGKTVTVPPPTKEEEEEAAKPVAILPAAAAEESQKEEEEEELANIATIDWRSIVKPETFLNEYMSITTQDTCPEEYHFWNGLIALGVAAGRDVMLDDHEPVAPNLFVCLTGPSGAGKSRATKHLERIIRQAIPYNAAPSRGVRHIKSPGSAEYLVAQLQGMHDNPMNPKVQLGSPVRAVVEFGELAGLMNTANRTGNNMKPQLMEIYDANEVIESGSLGGGLRRAENAFGSVISTTQNRSLRKLLDSGDDGSGFINRWIFATGQTKPQLSFGGAHIDLGGPGDKLKQIHQWCFTSKKIGLSADAFAKWDAFFHSTVHPVQTQANRQGTAVLGRIDLLMKKLMLLFAINRMESVVSELSVDEAISLWPYILKTYGQVGKEIKKTDDTDLRDEILSQIMRMTKKNGKPPSQRELLDATKRKIKSDKQMADLIKVMILNGYIHEEKSQAGTRGRPTTRYAINE